MNKIKLGVYWIIYCARMSFLLLLVVLISPLVLGEAILIKIGESWDSYKSWEKGKTQ